MAKLTATAKKIAKFEGRIKRAKTSIVLNTSKIKALRKR